MRSHCLGFPLTVEPDPILTDAQEHQAVSRFAVVAVALGRRHHRPSAHERMGWLARSHAAIALLDDKE